MSEDIQFDVRGGLDLSVVIRTLVFRDGLAHLHAHGIVHRDVRGVNVLVDRITASSIRVRVSDFGVSSHLDTGADGGLVTHVYDEGKFPWPYAPPEMFEARPKTSPAGDVYMAAGLIYEVVTLGGVPFDWVTGTAQFRTLYDDDLSLWDKAQTIAREIYGAGADFSEAATSTEIRELTRVSA